VGASDIISRVVVLARIERVVPVLHHDGGLAGVVLPVLPLPQRLVVEVSGRLNVERRLLVARGGLVAAEAAGDMAEGLPLRFDIDGLDLDGHGIPPRAYWRGARGSVSLDGALADWTRRRRPCCRERQ